MGISKAFVQKTLKKHMKKLGDARIDCSYESFTNPKPDYDADDGAINSDASTTIPSIKVTFADFSFLKNQSGWAEVEGQPALEEDKKGIVEFVDFGGIVPKKDDLLTRIDTGVIFSVVGANVDPYDGAYLLHLKPTG